MSTFRDLLGDPEADSGVDAYGVPRINYGGNEETKRKVLQTEIPETEHGRLWVRVELRARRRALRQRDGRPPG